MMSAQMNNCRRVAFHSWESQTCETLAFQEKKTSFFLHDTRFVIFFLHLPPFPLDFILRLHADGCRLAGMLTLDAWLKKIALRKQLTLDTPSEPLSETQTSGLCSVLSFVICSIAHRLHYVCVGAQVCQHPKLRPVPQIGGPQGNHQRAESLMFAQHHTTKWKDQSIN